MARDASSITPQEESAGGNAEDDRWFRALIQHSGVVMAVVDVFGVFRYVSPSVTALTGLSPEELVGTSAFDHVEPTDREVVRLRFSELVHDQGSAHTEEFRIRTKGGRWIWIEAVAVNRLHDPVVDGVIINYRDVGARREAQERLRRSQSLLSAAQTASHIGSFEWNMRTGEVAWSDELYRIFGHAPNSIDVHYEAFIGAVHPDDRERVDADIQAAIAAREPFAVEFRSVNPGGDIRWIRSWGEFSFEDGETGSLLGSSQDVTESRHAELETAALHRQQQELTDQLRMLLESTVEGICGVDVEGRCTFINRAAAEMLGYEPEELHGRRMHDLVHHTKVDGSKYPAVDCPIVTASQAGEAAAVGQEMFWRKDGSSFPIEYSSHPLVKDEPVGAVLVFRDISDRLRMETELRANEELLRGVLDNSPAVIYAKRADGRYLLCNRVALDVFGLTSDQVIGRTDHDIFPPDLADALTANDCAVFQGAAMNLEEQAADATGKVRTFLSLKFPLMDAEGHPYALCGISTDITERVNSEQERVALEGRLRQSQRMESIGQLAGGVAHDFNNLLAVILNYAEFLVEDLGPEDSRLGDVQEIVKAGNKAAQLVQQLLAFSRQEVIEPEIVDLNEVIADLHEILRRSIGEDIELKFEAHPELPPVKADPGQLEQVLLNLAVNARDAMEDGGSLVITTGIQSIESPARLGLAEGEYLRMTVRDTGCGMDQETADRVFEPFFTTKGRGQGTGLGLSTVYGIIKQARGGVCVDSTPGEGTTFSIYIPVASEIGSEPHPGIIGPDEGPRQDEDRGTILVVEDEEGVRSLVSRILLKQGFDVVSFSGGEEALEYCRSNLGDIDLLLTDVVMPKTSGKALSDSLRLMRPDLKTLFMSGYTDEIIARRGVLDRAEQLVQKPFTADEIVARVSSLLEEARQP